MKYEELEKFNLEEKAEALIKKVVELEKENLELKLVLEEAGLTDMKVNLSETEYICLSQLRMLKERAELDMLNKDEINAVDVLHRNLLIARNIPIIKKGKEKKKTKEELLKIVSGK